MLINKLKGFLKYLRNKKILITTHELVDIDGFVSCYSLKFFLNQYFKNQQISIFFSEIAKSTKNFMNKFNEKFPEIDFSYNQDINISNYDICLILDTNNISQVKFPNLLEISSLNIPYIFIDHHYTEISSTSSNKQSTDLIYDDFSSTTEIILKIFEYCNQPLTPSLKTLMIAAILTDSGFFKYGNNNTIKNVSNLLDSRLKFQDILILLRSEIDISEKIARIKGLQRVEIIRERNYLIGISNVSSFGASVATLLTKIGFDISIVVSKEKLLYRFYTRAKKRICLKTGLHLGKILEQVAASCNGSGGGHDGAASLTCEAEVNSTINKIIMKIKQFL